MNNCHECGTVLIDGQLLCPSCGAANPEIAEPEPDTAQTEPASAEDVSEPVKLQDTIAAPVKPAVPAPKRGLRSNRGMTTSTKAWIAIGVGAAIIAGVMFWMIRTKHDRIMILTSLTAEDMKMLAADMPPRLRQQLATSPEARKDFAEQIKQILSLAAEARSRGIGDKPETKDQLDLMRSLIVAELFDKKQADARGPSPPYADVTETEISAFVAEKGQEPKFNHFIQVAQKMGLFGEKEIPDEQRKQVQDQWAKVMITERKAVKAGFDQKRNIQLNVALQQAQVLARQFVKEILEPEVKPTDAEIDAYIAAHPELDENKLRATADDVLKRVRAGEDFAALAKQYSSDPGNKDTGGELPWFGRNEMAKEFEEAAFKLQPGQISDVVKTPFGFHIIKVDERRTQKGTDGKKGEEQIHARHILISSGVNSDPRRGGPPQSGRDIAHDAVEKEKSDKMIADITKRNNITVAENFEVEAPPAPKQPQFPGMPPGMEMQQGSPPGASNEEVVPPGPNPRKGGKGKQPASKSGGG